MTEVTKQKQGPCVKIPHWGPRYQHPRSQPTCQEVLLCPFVPEGRGEGCMAKLDQEGSIRQPPQHKGGNVLSGLCSTVPGTRLPQSLAAIVQNISL